MNSRHPRQRHIVVPISLLLITLLTSCLQAETRETGPPSSAAQEDRPAKQLLTPQPEPRPVDLPADDGPHDRLTEWWYYTGHLEAESGERYGFEFVIFQVLRAGFAPTYASHFAMTDTNDDQFQYAERVSLGEPELSDRILHLPVQDWLLSGGDGNDQIVADMPEYGLELQLTATKNPVLHDGDGYFEFGPGSKSYYYSRTRMNAAGTVRDGEETLQVTGSAWMDHQWGDFLVSADLGWDWFSLQLDNEREIMIWTSHTGDLEPVAGSGTLVYEDGSVQNMPLDEFDMEITRLWTSPNSGGTYPMGWILTVEGEDIEIEMTPVLDDQELLAVDSTGVIYWEGMIEISGQWGDEEIEGLGYVEMTGYASLENLEE